MKKILALTLLLTACAITPPMSPQQIRAMQMRSFEDTTYENVFRSLKTVLQDEGYVIKNQDMVGGLIVGSNQRTDGMSNFNMVFNAGKNYRTGESYEVSVNLEKVGKTVETRMTIQKMESYSMGGSQGNPILEPETYKNIYQKVSVEIKRRQAQGKAG
jgi:hypothetical protein